METLDDVLAHFGIKGMRWGVRRKRGSDGTVDGPPGSSSEEAARAHTLNAVAQRSGVRTLSNKELQDVVTRLNLEKQYSNLTTVKEDQSLASKGGKFVREMLVSIGKQQIKTAANDAAAKAIGAKLAKKK